MRERFAHDEGQVLGLALVFLTFVALVLAATLTAATTNLRVTQNLTQQRDERYAAEAGVLAATAEMRGDRSIGADRGLASKPCGYDSPPDFVNSMQVRVDCGPRPGSGEGSGAANRPDYSVLALTKAPVCANGDPSCNEGVIDVNGGGPNVKAFGSTGSLGVCDLSCDPISDPTNADPGYSPLPKPAAPHSPTCKQTAVIFYPGTYNAPPSTLCPGNKPWLFQSAPFPGTQGPSVVYYFDFTDNSTSHVWTINNTVVGGTPSGWDPNAAGSVPTLPGACKTERSLAPNAGVQFVFGGDSRLVVGSSGQLELCAQPSTDQQQIAMYGLSTDAELPQQFPWDPVNAVNAGTSQYDDKPNNWEIDPRDGKVAQASIPANESAALDFTFPTPALPPGAIVTKAELEIDHYENPGSAASLSIDFPDGYGGRPVPPCNPAFGCTVGAQRLDVTSQLLHDPTLLSGFSATFTATAGSVGYDSFVDGIQLDLTLAPAPNGYRALTGCTTQAADGPASNPVQLCPLLSSSPGAAIYMQGTVYAPTGGVDVAVQPTNPSDPVLFNRGLIARTVVFRTQPGGSGSAQVVTAGGAFDRWVTLNATVNNGHLRLSTSVSFADAQASLSGDPPTIPPKITYNSWDLK